MRQSTHSHNISVSIFKKCSKIYTILCLINIANLFDDTQLASIAMR